ncbi:MAG: L-glutamate gamma-semialdehyde dehydrogenase [Flavobacteriaceae bacterium]|nr:L-glutamate gamma-semialdehyde dehydrogenase [Flavobacteriaceae bacterium]
MANGIYQVPEPQNESVRVYAPGSKERKEAQKVYDELYEQSIEIPLYIGGEEIYTRDISVITPPHEHQKKIGSFHKANQNQVELAINSALKAKSQWANMAWESRAAIFLKAAELIAGPYRNEIIATTMLCQSKTIYQAEIDAACELIDFLRFNVFFMQEIYKQQPKSTAKVWNQLSYRPLEGFVYAISPFNFTAIAGNLCSSVALMGNTVVWKPSDYQVYSANVIMKVFIEAGLPDGVINMIYGDPEMITDTVLDSPDFAGIHFTGSTTVFKGIWKKIGQRIHIYKSYPRIVGETGGKDFIVAHPSASVEALSTAIIRGGFEFQGQKCSAASRVYLPLSLADKVVEHILSELKTITVGSPRNFKNFVTSVIHKGAYERLKKAIEMVKASDEAKIVCGGGYDKKVGYFIEPTIVVTNNPKFKTMETELFGPLITIYIYQDHRFEETLKLVDTTSPYALTGSIFSQERLPIHKALKLLENSAGNFYINDKPTGAVVGHQPFGGSRSSGTNDKAGWSLNLLRWVSPRLIKEPLVPDLDYRYPFLAED